MRIRTSRKPLRVLQWKKEKKLFIEQTIRDGGELLTLALDDHDLLLCSGGGGRRSTVVNGGLCLPLCLTNRLKALGHVLPANKKKQRSHEDGLGERKK